MLALSTCSPRLAAVRTDLTPDRTTFLELTNKPVNDSGHDLKYEIGLG